MHALTELPAWERLLKKIVWEQLGPLTGLRILDFGSGQGVTASHFARDNRVVAVEPSADMLKDAWTDHPYEQVAGGIEALAGFEDGAFDAVLCHNVLEYVDDKAGVVRALDRVLRPGGTLSVVKHNRLGRVMQAAVLLDDFDRANALLDGRDDVASRFGAIRYYEDEDIPRWVEGLQLAQCFGIRAFWDLQQNQEKHASEDWQARMMQLDMRVSRMEPFRRIAFFHHLIYTKK